MKRNKLILIIAVTVCIFSACSKSEDSENYWGGGMRGDSVTSAGMELRDEMGYADMNMAYEPAPEAAPAPSQTADQVGWEEVAERPERHIIQTANVEMETEEFDDVVSRLRGLTRDDGYIESEILSTHTRRIFTIVIRIPAASFENLLAEAESFGTIRSANQNAQDVTDQFHDLASNLETRRIEEERILALIDEAETVQDLLALETRLSNTRLAIETYLAQLNNMAGQISFSTISVTLYDVSEEEIIVAKPTLGERIGGAFGDSVDNTVNAAQNFIIFLAGAIIPLAILAVFGFIIYKIARVVQKKVKLRSAS